MKNKQILSYLLGILITSFYFNTNTMEEVTTVLPTDFYAQQAKAYVENFKDSKYCKENLTNRLDWFKDIKKGKVNKVNELVTCRDPESKKIIGFGVKTGEYKLSDIQKHIDIVVETVLAHQDSYLGNVLHNYRDKLKLIFKLSIFKRIGSYWGEKIPLYEQWKLTPVNQGLFKKMFEYFGKFKNFKTIFLTEAIYFTKECLKELEKQSLINHNSDSSE